ncbi:hypothetical protein KM043_016754 [Ampulex compressa]|nr:hypothetical protein KM043_016754 [Ampulex compressa]
MPAVYGERCLTYHQPQRLLHLQFVVEKPQTIRFSRHFFSKSNLPAYLYRLRRAVLSGVSPNLSHDTRGQRMPSNRSKLLIKGRTCPMTVFCGDGRTLHPCAGKFPLCPHKPFARPHASSWNLFAISLTADHPRAALLKNIRGSNVRKLAQKVNVEAFERKITLSKMEN